MSNMIQPDISFKTRQLQALVAVFDNQTMIRASEVLGLTQPAVSSAIKTLETRLGHILFERGGHNLKPTKIAEIFVKRIKLAFAHLKLAESEIKARHSDNKNIRIISRISEIQIRAYDSFYQTRNLTVAAQNTGISQPNIHRALSELSAIIGYELFRRDGAPFIFTIDGEILARKAGLYLKEIELAVSEINAANGIISGSVNIGALPLARSKWLPAAIANFAQKHPTISFKIIDGSYEEQLEALLSGRIDYIFGALRPQNPHNSIMQTELFKDPLVIAMSARHEFARNFNSDTDKLSNQQLASIRWIIPRKNTPARTQFENFMLAKGIIPPENVIECSSLVAARAMLLESNFAALFSVRQIEPELKSGLLKIMGPPLTGTMRAIGITQRKGFVPSKTLETFIKITKEEAKKQN